MSKYNISFSRKLAKNTNKKTSDLETKLKHFEKHCENYVDNIDYKVCSTTICNIRRKSKRYKN